MTTFLIILVVLAAIATLVALVRGIVTFLRTTEADLKGTGASASGLKQNKMMMQRVTFQAAAVLIAALALLLSR
ncbi:archaellin [Sphingomonas jejuensis]|uniref:Archaellin n=1 Tax=Sphingomonas jejuensis TaxID=904715 RepID=A0ABX0XNM8_9SPHN|nr:twin transmembrane helix small protein [Sphingomonas jejuensis]NJC34983.1 archaellin [Sphingomonas jejuensis]